MMPIENYRFILENYDKMTSKEIGVKLNISRQKVNSGIQWLRRQGFELLVKRKESVVDKLKEEFPQLLTNGRGRPKKAKYTLVTPEDQKPAYTSPQQPDNVLSVSVGACTDT